MAKTVKIDEETWRKLKAISSGYNHYMNCKHSVADTIRRLCQYEWENPAYQDEEDAKAIAKAEYDRLK